MTIFSDVLHKQIDTAKQIINKTNLVGNSDGLISSFSLQNRTNEFTWEVNCANSSWFKTKREQIESGNFNDLSSLGFSLYLDKSRVSEFGELFNLGIKSLKSKDAFPEDRVSFVFYPKQFLGIVLGLISTNNQDALSWIKNSIIPTRKNFGESEKINELLYNVIESIVSNKIIEFTTEQIKALDNVEQISIVFWGAKRSYYRLYLDEIGLRNLKELILKNFLTTNLQEVHNWCISFILSAVYDCIYESVNNVILDISHVSKVLENFQSAMERWVWKENNRWKIENESDVQSILWLILRSYFDDAVYEEPTQKFGRTSSKLDFKIPSLSLIIEAKYIKDPRRFGDIEKEIKEDSINYPKSTGLKNIIVFIYDNTSSVQKHSTTKSSLKQIDNIKDVIIASKPSHID